MLCTGIAVPASACLLPGDGAPAAARTPVVLTAEHTRAGADLQREAVWQHEHDRVTLAQAKAWATAYLDRARTALQAAKAKVAADPGFTDAQKTAVTARIDQALAAVDAAQQAVDAATTPAEVRAAFAQLDPHIALPAHHRWEHRERRSDHRVDHPGDHHAAAATHTGTRTVRVAAYSSRHRAGDAGTWTHHGAGTWGEHDGWGGSDYRDGSNQQDGSGYGSGYGSGHEDSGWSGDR